jgi:spermidine synthase
MLDTLPFMHPQGRKALLIGLGGGYLVGSLYRHGIATDAIEIDPKVVEAARSYFDFEPTGALIVDDARYAIRKLDEQYDLIIHDSFTGGSMPVHLLSAEMLEDLRRLLRNDGLLALVFVGFAQGEEARAAASVYRTLGQVFAHRRVFVTRPGENFNDFVFLAAERPIDIDPARASTPEGQSALEWMLVHEQGMDESQGVLITDDFNPLESMQIAKAEAYRQMLLERVDVDLLMW